MTSVKKEKSDVNRIGEILDVSRALPRRLNDVETLRFSLEELKQRAISLRPKRQEHINKAQYILMGQGINAEDIMNQLDKISLEVNKNHQNLKEEEKLNFVKKEEVAVNYSSIEQSLHKSNEDFENYVNENIQLDWKVRKKELKDKLNGILKRDISMNSNSFENKKLNAKEMLQKQLNWGNKKPKSLISSNFKFQDLKNSSNPELVNPNISFAMRRKFELYAEIIYELNNARQDKKPFKLASMFYELNKNENSKNDQFIESLNMLKELCETEEDGIDLRDCYQTDTLNDFKSIKLRNYYVKKSRSYLERQFRDFVNELYSKTLDGSQLRSTKPISILDKMSNFINLTLKDSKGQYKVKNLTFVNGVPIWALIFYCIRGGFKSEALLLLERYQDSFEKLESYFPIYLKEYYENNNELSFESQGKINNEFNQYFKLNNSIDPFKLGVYKIIGRLDLARKSIQQIPFSIEDWIWFHLVLIKEGGEIENGECYSLIDLRNNILEFGSESFNGSNSNSMYLQTLILVGLNEEAVKYYMDVDEIDGIHLSILLNYYGILRVKNDEISELLLNETAEGFKEINFGRLIGYYVKNFKLSDPVVSAEYLILIGLNDFELCQEEIRDLVLQSGEYLLLLGKIDHLGIRQGGILEKRRELLGLKDENKYLFKISELAGQLAERGGQIKDAISLYQLSEEYDIVLRIINGVLSDVLNQGLNNSFIFNQNDEEYFKIGFNLLNIFKKISSNGKVNLNEVLNLEKLLKVYDIVERVNNSERNDKNFKDKLISEIKELNVLPIIDSESNIETIRRRIKDLESVNDNLIKLLPVLIIISLNLLKGETNNNIVKNIMIFTGLIKFKLPRDIYSKIINLNVDELSMTRMGTA